MKKKIRTERRDFFRKAALSSAGLLGMPFLSAVSAGTQKKEISSNIVSILNNFHIEFHDLDTFDHSAFKERTYEIKSLM